MIHFILKLLTLLIFSKADYEDSYSKSELLGYKEGIVGNESFVYYYIHHSGNIVLVLNSSIGDADIYISGNKMFPTFYPDTYDHHSANCGVDIIEVPIGFNSPIAVGIYGHPAHEISIFILKVLKNPEAERAFAIVDSEPPQEITETSYLPSDGSKVKSIKSKVRRRSQAAEKVSWFYSALEILDLIFL